MALHEYYLCGPRGPTFHSWQRQFFLFLKLFTWSWFKYFFLLKQFRFYCCEYSTFWPYSIFCNTQIHLKNFLQYQIFCTILWLGKFSTVAKFLYYFSDLENQFRTFRFSLSEKASQNLYKWWKKWKMIFWHVNSFSVDQGTLTENIARECKFDFCLS